MSVIVSLDALRRVVREEVRRALLEAMLELIPYVDKEEQRGLDEILRELKNQNTPCKLQIDWRKVPRETEHLLNEVLKEVLKN